MNTTTQAIRAELKIAFPKIKFSVRKRNYNSVEVEWTEGPMTEEVEKIISKYEMGTFNGMTDCYEYDNRNNNLPQVKFVFPRRIITEKTRAAVQAQLSEAFGIDFNDSKAVFEKFSQWPDMVIGQEIRQPGRWLISRKAA